MDTNKECRYCRCYLNRDNIYIKLYNNLFGKYCSLYCYNISDMILHNTNHDDNGRLCSYCGYIFTIFTIFTSDIFGNTSSEYNCLYHHCSIPIKNKYMNINIL